MSHDVLLWLDLETTGLDHTTGEILEVAAVPTTMDLEYLIDSPEGHGWNYIVSPTVEPMTLMGDEVAIMHTGNELISEVWESSAPIWWVDHHLSEMLGSFDTPLMLAGSGVAQFDIHWIRRHMPKLARLVSYRTIDVGQIERFIKYIGGADDHGPVWDLAPRVESNHRAMADVEDAIRRARHLKGIMT